MGRALLPPVVACILLGSSPVHAAEEPPTLLNVRFSGLFADYEYDFSPGFISSLAGVEGSFVLPRGLTLEAGSELLLALAGGGWASVVRGGWRYVLHGTPTTEANSWFGSLTPLAGVRWGRMPYTGASDGFTLSTFAVGPQLALAYDLVHGGRGLGFAARLFAAANYRAINDGADTSEWVYASGPAARFSVEGGLSVGFSFSL